MALSWGCVGVGLAPAQDPGETQIRITGSVFGADGRPQAGATVSLAPVMDDFSAYDHWLDGDRMWAAPVDSATTSAEGRYSLDAPSGSRWRLLVEHSEHATVTRRLAPILRDREMQPVKLRPARSLEVEVRTPDGRPVEGVRMMGSAQAVTNDLWPYSWSAARTDALGQARLLVARPDPWNLLVVAEGFAPMEALQRGSPQIRIEAEPGARLDVRFLRDDEPAAGVVVVFPDQGVTLGKSDEQGRVE